MNTTLITLVMFLSVPVTVACRQGGNVERTQTQGSADSTHRVISVDWRAQLAAVKSDLEREPNSSFLHGQAAMAYDALGDFDNFDREIQMAMRLDSANSMPCYMAYAVYKRRRFLDKQEMVLDRALKIDPNNPFGHYEKASMFEDAKDWQGAFKEYEAARKLLQQLKSNPQNSQNNSWRYVDARGNPYEVTIEMSHISDDIARVRQKTLGQK